MRIEEKGFELSASPAPKPPMAHQIIGGPWAAFLFGPREPRFVTYASFVLGTLVVLVIAFSKHGRTERGKYSAKYALSERLVCGECGSPYKRCTWARNGKKRVVWRCVSRLEFGTRYCSHSPTLDEDRLHRAIVEAVNAFAGTKEEITQDFLDLAGAALEHGSPDLAALRQRLAEVTARQGQLLDQVLEHMDDPDLNAQLTAVMEETQSLQEQIRQRERDAVHGRLQAARMAELRAWVEELEINGEYSDEQVRMAIEKITVVDAETIRIQFRYPGLEIEKKLV